MLEYKLPLVSGLQSNRVTPEDVNYVICTHGHSDHVGNLNLFPSAVHIVSYDICKGDEYILHDFAQVIVSFFFLWLWCLRKGGGEVQNSYDKS
jgi:glyoxylase-like metal-dependent hydrolase (beta-lactamase superfamily II)